MPVVRFTYALKRFFPGISEIRLEGRSVGDILAAVDKVHPGMRSYLLDDQGRVRQHVQIYLDGQPLTDRQGLSDPVDPETEIYLMQALSGG